MTHATIVTAPGKTIDAGTIVLRDGLVESVSKDAAIPPDAVEIDLKGSFVYPGLIDAGGKVFGASGEEATRSRAPGERGQSSQHPEPPRSGAAHAIALVHPESLARDQLLPFDDDERKRDAGTYRDLGFTTMLAAPGKGIFAGQSALILLQPDRRVPQLVIREAAAQHVGFEWGSFGDAYPTSLMGAVAAIRQTLLDAQRFAIWSARYEANPAGMRRPDRVAAFEALAPALARKQLVIFEAKDPADALLADRLAKEFNLDAAILGSGFEWEIAADVAETHRTLIFPVAVPDKPKVEDADEALDVSSRELRRYVDAPSGPSLLHRAGVDLAFTTRGLKNPADFPKNLRKILDAGLSEEVALAALTTVPARLLGVERVTGTLEPGKIANLVVADGPLFGKETKVRRVFVDGTEYKVEEKKKPQGDPNAIVDPRGTWSVVIEFGTQSVSRTWTISGTKGALTGTAETRSGTVTLERVELTGNALTIVFPPTAERGSSEATVIVTGDTFEGTMETDRRSVPVTGTRTSGPEGGA